MAGTITPQILHPQLCMFAPHFQHRGCNQVAGHGGRRARADQGMQPRATCDSHRFTLGPLDPFQVGFVALHKRTNVLVSHACRAGH